MFWLVIAGELDVDASAGLKQQTKLTDSNLIEELPATKGGSYVVAVGLMMVFGFVMGTSLMNIYIAVLGSNYEKASAETESEFMRARAEIIMDRLIKRQGFTAIWRFCTCKTWEARTLTGKTREEATDSFLWFAMPSTAQEMETLVADFHNWN